MGSFRSSISVFLLSLFVAPLACSKTITVQLDCRMLPVEECAFAVDSHGNRCVLERFLGNTDYVCQTSDIAVGDGSPVEYIETDECIKACGVEKMTVGFSTDLFTSITSTSKLCSIECETGCANLVDLFSNMVAGEGATLAEKCIEHRRSLLTRVSDEESIAPTPQRWFLS